MVTPKVNIVEKRWFELLMFSFKLRGPTHGTKYVAREKLASFGLFGTRPWH